MRAWWWILITAHLVWGNPEQFKDDLGITDNLETNQNSATEDKPYPNFILNPEAAVYTSMRRGSEGDEREKKQMRFHSWGGKRAADEEEDIGDNGDTEDNVLLHEPGGEDLMTDVSLYLPSNESHLETDSLDDFKEMYREGVKSPPTFYSWVGQGEPEIMNDISKRSNCKKPEQSIKRYPYFSPQAGKRAAAFNSWGGKRAAAFNSWGGKRTAAFNSWGGKREYSTENRDYPKTNREIPKPKLGFNDYKENQAYLNNDQGYIMVNSLDSKNYLNTQDHDPDIDNDGEHSSRALPDDKEHHLPEERRFLPELEHSNLKRAVAFNSWAGKRMSEENPAVVKKPVSFNSWAGKRAAAFNSWGGKRAAAFNSWGGKRAGAFNSWGGKRAAAFNSWGGKRAAPFNSWGGKRAAAFNSWSGKKASTNAGPTNHVLLDQTDKTFQTLGNSDMSEKRTSPFFSSTGGKRSPLFSSWWGGKIPTMMLTSGKRRPAFSSWGGKRSEHKKVLQVDYSPDGMGDEHQTHQKPEEVHAEELSRPEGKTYTRKKREVECIGEKSTSVHSIERDKRASGNLLKNRVFTRMMLQGGWPMGFQSAMRGKDFFAWGGKRSLDGTTLR